MLVISPIKNNSSSPSFESAKFKFKSGVKEKIGDAIFSNVPSHQGLMDKYLKKDGTFNMDLFARHLRELVQEEPGFDGTYVVSSVKKLRGKNVHIATVKHLDEAGNEIKGEEFKFNPFNLLAKSSETQTELNTEDFFKSLMHSGGHPKLKKEITQANSINFWKA